MQRLPSEFVAKLSHDLKTPVGNAMMYSELLSEELLALARHHPEISDKLAMLETYSANIHLASSKLVNAIQSWGYSYQMEEGVYEISKSPVQLEALIRDLVSKNALFIQAKSLDVEVRYESSIGELNTDPELITLILDNLLMLMIHASPVRQRIRILTDDMDNGLRIRYVAHETAFKEKLIRFYEEAVAIKDHLSPDQGILKPAGYGLIFVNFALRYLGATHGVDPETVDPRAFWFCLPMS